MLSGVFATTAKMELRNLIDQYCYDCSEGWFMVYAETRGKYEEFYQHLLSDATALKTSLLTALMLVSFNEKW